MIARAESGPEPRPLDHLRNQKGQKRAIDDAHDGVHRALARRQPADLVLFDEIPEGDADLGEEQCQQAPGESAAPGHESQRADDDRVREIARRVKAQLHVSVRPVRQLQPVLMVVQRVEGAERSLQQQQPDRGSHEGRTVPA